MGGLSSIHGLRSVVYHRYGPEWEFSVNNFYFIQYLPWTVEVIYTV